MLLLLLMSKTKHICHFYAVILYLLLPRLPLTSGFIHHVRGHLHFSRWSSPVTSPKFSTFLKKSEQNEGTTRSDSFNQRVGE